VVFGPDRLPDIARKAGRFMTQVRRMADEVKDEFKTGLDLDDVGDEPDGEVVVEEDGAPGPPDDHPVAQALTSDNGSSGADAPTEPPLARLPTDEPSDAQESGESR
jgi:Sec-independent protein translocase protein TatA